MGLTWLCVAVALTVAGAQAERGGSSLRGALEALQRRQRGRVHPPLLPQPDYDALYEFVPPQGYPEPDYPVDVEDIEDEPNPKYIVKFLDESERPPETYEYKLIKKKSSHFNEAPNKQESSFRERAHHPNDKLRDLFMDKTETDDKKETSVSEKDAEYALLLGQLWSKYKYNKDHSNNIESAPQGVVKLYKEKVVKKRYPDSWGPIAYKRKRSSDFDVDRPILTDYEERKQDGGQSDPNYNAYELNDDDKDDLREEYAIAFQPLDDDTLSDLADDDQYTYDNAEKRFPVTKRSSGPYDFGTKKISQNQNKREAMKTYRSSSGTDPRIIKDLSKIFGDSGIEIIKNPVKRSSDHENVHHDGKPPMLPLEHHVNDTHEYNDTIVADDNSHELHGHNIHHPGFSGKEEEIEHDHNHHGHNVHHPGFSGKEEEIVHDHNHHGHNVQHPGFSGKEEEIVHDHSQHGHNLHHPGFSGKEEDIEHDHNHNHEHDHENEAAHKHLEKVTDRPIILRKKSIDWSDYFGIDKRKAFGNDQDRLRKQYFDTFNKEVIYPLNSFRRHSYSKRNYVKPKPDEGDMQILRSQSINAQDEKRNTADDNDSKLDNIDKKLKTMEGIIVDEALHFSNAGEELDSKEEQEMKEKLLSRLAAAYSLEKMRKALKEFKQTLQTPNSDVPPTRTDDAKAKRVAVKKELLNNEIPLVNKMEEKSDDFEDEQGAGHYLNGKVEEQFSEGYMGGSGRHRVPVVSTVSAAGSCPVLAKIVQRCRGVDLLAGDRGQLFLPLCSLHQICYLCGEAPPTTCDLVFLSEADTACEGDMSCQRAARSALMALRELHDNLADELDGECEASPCLPATLKLNVGWQRALQR